MSKMGFIGLGIMGKPMAKNLINAGYDLVVHDINRDPVREIVEFGAKAANSPREVAEKSEIIITMLPDSPEVKQVALGKDGLIEGVKEGQIYIDMSSIEPLVEKEISQELRKKGVAMLGAPVSGGERGAIEGSLAIMVGGDEGIFQKCREVLSVMGKNVVRVGELGSGQTAKLTNQMIVAVNIAAVAEALILGKKAGVNPKNIYEAIRGGLAGSTVLDRKAPLIMERKFEPGFKIDLHIKDLKNVLKTSHELNSSSPLTALVMEMMQSLKNEGCGQFDHGALALYYEKITNTKIE